MVWVPQEVAAPASKVSHVVNSSGIVGRERMLRVVMVHLCAAVHMPAAEGGAGMCQEAGGAAPW